MFQDFIDALSLAPLDDRQGFVDEFMQEASAAGFPFLEDTLAHFIYRGTISSSIGVAGDFNGWNPGTDRMTSVAGTDFYYLTRTFELDARLDYKFVIEGSPQQWILDPLNPNTIMGGFGPNSEVAMPGYVQPEEIAYMAGIAHGTKETFSFQSTILGNSRSVSVYLPPGYADNPSGSYPTLYVNDGGEYLTLASMDNVLDFLLDKGKIEDVIVVFVTPVDRNSEYWLNSDYRDMIVTELVPHIDSEYRTIDSPSERGIMGASLGGLISVYIAYEHPDVFGFSAGQSGAFWINSNQIIQMVSSGPAKDIRFYLDWGTYEDTIQQSNYDLRDVLLAKGYSFTQYEYHEGHSWGSWRAHTDDILRAFAGGSG
jgi:enterochelin esterase family protein